MHAVATSKPFASPMPAFGGLVACRLLARLNCSFASYRRLRFSFSGLSLCAP